MTAPADWYPDSQQPHLLRYWDGTAWTKHVHDPEAKKVEQQAAVQDAYIAATTLGQDPKGPTAAAREAAMPRNPPAVEVRPDGRSSLQEGVTQEDRSRATERRVTVFNAKKVAQELALEAEVLQAKFEQQNRVLAEYGIEDVAERARLAEALQVRVATLQDQVAAAEGQLASARRGLVEAGDQANLEEMGLFNYEHPAQTSAQLQTQLERVRGDVKTMVKNKQAVHASSGFTFNGSKAQGDKFVRNMSTIMLRAYNAEAENGIKSTKAGNLAAAQKRLGTVKDQIARQGSMISLAIDERYHKLRLKEQEIASAHLQRLAAEREAERERKAELREQKRVEAEIRAEKDRLEKERTHYVNSIAALQAKGDLVGSARLQEKLADVDRAIEDVDYRAANIRAGYVYVISNVGSLGEGTVKIGMTRRLEPMDRVKELGDASVPFTFDVHALFFSDDAVGIETMLHQTFAEQRVNKVNLRREFFRVTPDQVLDVLRSHAVEVLEFDLNASAEEFRASWPDGRLA